MDQEPAPICLFMSVSMQRYQNIELSSQVFAASKEVSYPLDPLATK